MPREGRELYELQYGARARRMLDEALDAGDIASVAEVSRRFFHTRSGYRATFLLGLDHFDHGRPLAAALTLERLRDAGDDAEEMEPGLTLTMATCWLQAGMTEKARQSLLSSGSVIRLFVWRLPAARFPSSPTTPQRSAGWWAWSGR